MQSAYALMSYLHIYIFAFMLLCIICFQDKLLQDVRLQLFIFYYQGAAMAYSTQIRTLGLESISGFKSRKRHLWMQEEHPTNKILPCLLCEKTLQFYQHCKRLFLYPKEEKPIYVDSSPGDKAEIKTVSYLFTIYILININL